MRPGEETGAGTLPADAPGGVADSGKSASPTLGPVLALVLNAFVWGVSWWPLRELQSHGLHPLWATALVYAIVVAGLSLAHFRAWRGCFAHPPRWWLAAASGLTNVGFNWAVTVGDVVRVVLLFYLMPAWSVLAGWLMLKEKPSPGSLMRLALAMGGVLVVLKTPDSPWPVPQGSADWLAILGGLSFAVTNALLRKHGRLPAGARMMAMFGGSGLMAAGVAALGVSLQVVPAPALAGAGVPVALGLSLAFLAGNAALQYGAARLAAASTAIVMLTEILFASVSSALLGAATLTWRIVIGGALILFAAVWSAWDGRAGAK